MDSVLLLEALGSDMPSEDGPSRMPTIQSLPQLSRQQLQHQFVETTKLRVVNNAMEEIAAIANATSNLLEPSAELPMELAMLPKHALDLPPLVPLMPLLLRQPFAEQPKIAVM